jgi:basic membrane protein A
VKRSLALVASALAVTVTLAGCGGGPASAPGDQTLSVAAPLSGMLGDKSFIDSANDGLTRAEHDLGVKVKVIQAGTNDTSAWERNLTDASASGSYKLIVTGGTIVASTLEKVAKQFPQQQYLIFDANSTLPNVHGITYAQNESSFLAGALAAIITTHPQQFPRAKGTKKIAFAGGQDVPVINDFAVGYQQGAKAIDPSVQVDIRYVNDFSNAQKGYDTASAQLRDGADVVYQVSAAAGLGVLQAAEDAGRYSIGSDADQSGLHPDSVAASGIKAVGDTVYQAIEQFQKGSLTPGETTNADMAAGGVGLVLNKALVPADVSSRLDGLKQQIVDKKITVDTTLAKQPAS